jgi:tRNA/rRNA methyltransferase
LPQAIHSRLSVVLVNTRNPLNIGAAARAISNFGFSQLKVVNPYQVAFREARSAVGASEILKSAEEYPGVAEAVSDCSLVVGTTAVGKREVKHLVHDLQEAAAVIRAQSGRIGLLFGSEKRGLSNEDLSYCHWVLRIPTVENHRSMNLAQAVAVCLYEISRQSDSELQPQAPQPATALELDRFTGFLTDVLYASRYTKDDTLPSTREKVRRLIRRLNLTSADSELLLGMLRKISHKE